MRWIHRYLINPSLNNQSSSTHGYEPFEYFLKVACDLLEGSLDGFILTLIKHFNQFLDRLGRLVQIFSSFYELVPLFSEVVILLKRLFVDMSKLLETFIDSVELFDELWVG